MDIRWKAARIKDAGQDGEITGYGSVFGVVDRYGEIVDRGAFSKTLKERSPKMLWQHDPSQPIGVWSDAKETDHGLRLNGQINLETAQGREAHALIKQGAVDGLSIGYIPVKWIVEEDNSSDQETKSVIMHLTEVKLYETSVVTFPANESALIAGIKSAKTIDDIKELLEHFAPDLCTAAAEQDLHEAAKSTPDEPDDCHSLHQLIKAIRGQ